MKPHIVFTTASSLEEARKLAEVALQSKLAACVQIIPGVESHYWWEGKLQQGMEFLLVIKSESARFNELCTAIKKNHSYECPEIVAINPESVDEKYAHWWEQTLKQQTGI